MNGLGINRKCRRQLRAACAGLVLIAGLASLSACGEASSGYDYETASHHDPAELEALKGKDVYRVTIDAEGVERAGIQTAPIRQNGQEGTVMPHSAVIFDADGVLIDHDRLDGWVNFAYRALKSSRDGRPLATSATAVTLHTSHSCR